MNAIAPSLGLALASPTACRHWIREALEALSADPAHAIAVASIKPGRFRRDATNPDYAARSAYTGALRRYMYNPAVLECIFGDPSLQSLFFRTFGYTGPTDFTVYPNAWLRDLPLLDLGHGCYLADGIVLGTNQVSVDQQVLTVDRIGVGDNTVFDQQCMVGYGAAVGPDCTIGARVLIGMRSRIGSRSQIRPMSAVGHHCRVGHGVQIGHGVMLGAFSVVEDGVRIDDYAQVPEFSRVTSRGVAARRRREVGPVPPAEAGQLTLAS